MKHPFDALRGEYERLLAACQITKRFEAQVAAKRILALKPRYEAVAQKTGVPVLWLMVINERESGSNLFTYLGNGQSLRQVTTLVPRGRGPFDSWEAGAEDALHLDRIDRVALWNWPMALFEEEGWNGFGPRDHGRHTGYLWAGTNIYDGGKYVADGVWNPNAWDSQLGCVPLMQTLVSLDHTLDLPAGIPADPAQPIPGPQSSPPGLDGGQHGVVWLQTFLNKLIAAQRLNADALVVDGSYGRFTRAAVRQFQAEYDCIVDGIAGPQTIANLEAAVARYAGDK